MSNTRRDKGTGSVYYVETIGKWRAKIVVDGKPISRTANTEREAKQKLRELIRKQESLAKASIEKYSNVPFEYYAKDWLENSKKNHLAPSSYRNLSYDIMHYVVPEIGSISIKNLTSNDIQGIIQKMIKDNRSLSTIKRVKSSINNCLQYAVKHKDIEFNPCSLVEMPSKKAFPNIAKQPICVFTEDEINRYVLRAIEHWPNGTPIYRLGWGFVLILATGIRREEAAALEWSDINEKTKLVHIHQTASYVLDAKSEKTVQKILPLTKSSSSDRFIPLNETALDAINHLKEVTGKYRYVFGVSENNPISMNTLNRMNNRITNAANIKRPDNVKIGLHALRHTFCSHLIMSDPPMDIKTISEIMGHSDTRITMDIYGHIFEERKQQAVNTADFIKKSIKK